MELSFGTRLWFAWVCFFRVLFDGAFAARAFAAREPSPALPTQKEPERLPEKKKEREKAKDMELPSVEPALQLLSLFQREGRFLDFLQEDVTSFPDADVGAAARLVHDGCRKALRNHGKLSPVRVEEEGSKVTVKEGTPPSEVKLVGNVTGSAPFTGTLRHRGWRIDELSLPTAMAGHDARIVAPAEVEL